MVQEINWTTRAFEDLRDIYEYIAKDSMNYAQIQVQRIQDETTHLQNFPLIGHILPEFPNLSYCELIVSNYRILYRYDDSKNIIYIMAGVHGKRLLNNNLL